MIDYSPPPPIERVKSSEVEVTITAQISKRCPFKGEVDHGVVVINHRTTNGAYELHSLRSFLDQFAHRAVSHEDLTWALAATFRGDVTTRWHTAGMEVECHAVLRESDDRAGA